MRRSEFERAVAEEFGVHGPTLVADLVLSEIGDRTAAQAMAEGIPPREIWLALCSETDVPLARRHGAGRLEPRR